MNIFDIKSYRFLNKINNTYVFLLLLLLGFLLYGNTLGHDYALDDALVITENSFTKKGIDGISDHMSNDLLTGFYGQQKQLVAGGRYRPLSLILFSIEYEFFEDEPLIGHLMNLLFYVLNAFLLFLLLKLMLEQRFTSNTLVQLSLLTTLLWFFHPIHTEVVANIKGRDEILSFSLSLYSLYLSLKYIDSNNFKYLPAVSLVFFLALLAKENSITWLAIIPCSLYYFRKVELSKVFALSMALLLPSILWFLLRMNAVGAVGNMQSVADNLMNDPFLLSSTSEKYATIVYTLGKYVQLLFFPHPLTFDYYPKHIPILNWSHPLVILSIAVLGGLLYVFIKGFKNKSIASYSILFFGISLSIASNLFFPIGAFMNERFIYSSSLAFCLILAYYAIIAYYKKEWENSKKILLAGFLIIFVLYSYKSISRNAVWKNNLTLASHDANISVRGAKSNVMAGGLLLEESYTAKAGQKNELLNQSIFHLKRALKVYPEYLDALLLMGNAKWEKTALASEAMPFYHRILNINKGHSNAWRNIHIVLNQNKNKDYSIAAYEKLLSIVPSQIPIYIHLGKLYGQYRNNLSKAIEILEKGRKLAPKNMEILSNLGIAYGMQQNYTQAIEVLEMAESIEPKNAKIKSDLGLSYYFAGRTEKARMKFDEAVILDKSLNRAQFPI